MKQETIVSLIDEEIARLRQVRDILQSLLPSETVIASILDAAAVDNIQAQPKAPTEEISGNAEEISDKAAPVLVRHISRRGMATGRRGPRHVMRPTVPRPLDCVVPLGPVVVQRTSLVASQPSPSVALVPEKSKLDAWLHFLQPDAPAPASHVGSRAWPSESLSTSTV